MCEVWLRNTSDVFFVYKDKWYIILFPAENFSSYTTSKSFETEITKTMVRKTQQSDKREADNPQNLWMAKKRSLLPKGSSANHSESILKWERGRRRQRIRRRRSRWQRIWQTKIQEDTESSDWTVTSMLQFCCANKISLCRPFERFTFWASYNMV